MPLSWNEIKSRAITFSKEWKDTHNEEADAKPFLDGFFDVFGITRRKQATFEHRVKKLDEGRGYIDLLWKGTILVEMKSKGKDLDKAYSQAKDYVDGLPEHEIPKYILVCDFERFHLYDIEERTEIEFVLPELVKNVKSFQFLLGYPTFTNVVQEEANIKAAEMMGKLHDSLKAIGYTGHALEVYLVRLLFCLFAEDTTIFEKQQFQEFIERRTNNDGSDLARSIQELFQVLNTPNESRFKNLDEDIAAFPYVNGKLFEENLPIASFDSKMREALLKCCYIDWSKISPAIFGSMFQSVMDEKERRNLGAHYTSETNILKVIKPLFLDELWAEFYKVKSNKNLLHEFHVKLSKLTFLDPACGCGNFLVITYRELRKLEIEILRASINRDLPKLDMDIYIMLDVNMMYGIEYEEFPARIASVAMWLIDHQMNMLISEEFGQYFVRLPLRKSATIVHENALRFDWGDIIEKDKLSYILGNPPFIGHQWRNEEQAKDMEIVFGKVGRSGRLDYVAAWYLKAAHFIKSTGIKVAFVSTNSIAQGEQVIILWSLLFNNYGIKIHFAHRSFRWNNEAKGNAGVHVVIVGFANFDTSNKILFDYENNKGEPSAIKVKNINSYLTEGNEVLITSRGKPIHKFPEIFKGSQPTDGGFLVLSELEANELIEGEDNIRKWIKPFWGADEFLYSKKRYCLWLKGIHPNELMAMKGIKERLNGVIETRLKSPTPSVKSYAKFPTLFTQDRQPETTYLAIPEVSSENRQYIPIGFLSSDIICSNKLQVIPNATLYIFGVLQSIMHMTWTHYVCGRLESRISYSPAVYNNFPFPLNPSDKQVKDIETAAQRVLDKRLLFTPSSLAVLYDPITMPVDLVKAHNELDKAVDAMYSKSKFDTEVKRMEFLFALYEKYTGELFHKAPTKKRVKIK